MAQIILNGFNIIAGFQASNGKRMTEIMEASGIQTDFFDSVLESFINIDIAMKTAHAFTGAVFIMILRVSGMNDHSGQALS